MLSRAQYFSKIDSEILDNIKKWIFKNQHEDGHFEDVFSESINDKMLVTAETIATFLEIGFDEVSVDTFNDTQMISHRKLSFVIFLMHG